LLRATIVLVYTDRIRHPLPLLGLANPPRRPGRSRRLDVRPATVSAAARSSSSSSPASALAARHHMRAAGEKKRCPAAQRGIQLSCSLSWALAGLAGTLAGISLFANVRLDPSLLASGSEGIRGRRVGGLDSPPA
jgi:hypothetical protein